MATPKYKRVLLKISGEALCKPGTGGIDGERLRRLADEVKLVVDLGVQVCVVVGGGNIVRGSAIAKDSPIEESTGHYMGMLGTVINALALQETLERFGLETRVQSAIAVDRVCEKFIRRRAIRHLEKNRVVILAGGTGNPFVTTDSCAALRGTELAVEIVMKATKVDGVYSEDPETNPAAEFYPTLSYNEVIDRRLKIMDLSAIDLCQQSNLPIMVFKLSTPGNMLKAIQGQQVGTLISAK